MCWVFYFLIGGTHMIRGVTYNRFSSTMQREESIDAQLRFNYEYAKRNDIEIIKDYSDEATTGKTDDRPAFQQMLQDAKNGLFEVIICHKVDRFARNRIESAINKYNLRKCNVKVVFSGQAIDDSPEGQLMEGILESMAEYYSLNLAKETMKGLRENALKCKFNGGYVPFGYSIDPVTKTYIVNENEAKYVKLIFEMFSIGEKYETITNKLKMLGVKSRMGKDFCNSTLHDLLCNEKYIGIYTFNKRAPRNIDGKRNNRSRKSEKEIISIPGGIPQIIDTDLYLKVQSMLTCRKRATKKATVPYLLSGLVYCGSCEKPFCGNKKNNGSGYIYYKYRCNGRCGNKEIDKDFLEELVFNKLIENIFSKNAIEHLSKKLNEYLKNKKQIESKQLETIKLRIDQLLSEQNNIIGAIARGYDQPIFKQKLMEIDTELKDLKYNYEIAKIKLESKIISPNQIEEKLKEQRSSVLSKNVMEVKNFISDYVDNVIVYENDIEINLKFDTIPL